MQIFFAKLFLLLPLNVVRLDILIRIMVSNEIS